MQVQQIKLVAISDQFLVHLPPDRTYENIKLEDCIALLNPQAKSQARSKGLLLLADGQRFPGEAALNAKPQAETLAWNHPRLGRIDVPFKLIQSVLLTAEAVAPAPGKTDVVLLANGDKQEGFVTALGNPITLEVEHDGQRQNIDIPLNLVAAVTLVAPKQPPSGRRIWFEDGTVIDVQSIAVGDDGFVRLTGSSLASGTLPTGVGLSQIAAILLDPKGMIPLATLTPSRVEGPPLRYVLPKPQVLDPNAPLGLSKIEIRGPLVVRYTLPVGCQRFTAEAELPREARQWGDYDLVIRTNDDEVFRSHLNDATPTATINVPVTGRELTIELTQGAHGPIQDQLILNRAMLLNKP